MQASGLIGLRTGESRQVHAMHDAVSPNDGRMNFSIVMATSKVSSMCNTIGSISFRHVEDEQWRTGEEEVSSSVGAP